MKNDNVFYNPIFRTTVDNEVHEYTISPLEGSCILSLIKTYDDVLAEENTVPSQRTKWAARRNNKLIQNIRRSEYSNLIDTTKGGKNLLSSPAIKE